MLDEFRDALGYSHIRVQVVTSCFQQKYLVVRVFREAVSQHTACRSCPYDDVVIVVDSPSPLTIKQRIDGFAKEKAFERLILGIR